MDVPLGRALIPAIALLLAAVGCAAEDDDGLVNFYGSMMVGPVLGDPPRVLSGAHLDAYGDDGALLVEGKEPWPDDSPGYYRVRDLASGAHVHLVAWVEAGAGDASGDDDDSAGDDDDSAADAVAGYVATVHSAWMPPENLYVYDGELFILERSWLELELRYLTKGGLGRTVDEVVDPATEDSGGMILGTLADPETFEGTRVHLRSGTHKPLEALYLDEWGVARDTLTAVGPGGGFAAFDLPAGPARVTLELSDGTLLPPFTVLIVEDGCTSLLGTEIRHDFSR